MDIRPKTFATSLAAAAAVGFVAGWLASRIFSRGIVRVAKRVAGGGVDD
jgi:hypothetical protein